MEVVCSFLSLVFLGDCPRGSTEHPAQLSSSLGNATVARAKSWRQKGRESVYDEMSVNSPAFAARDYLAPWTEAGSPCALRTASSIVSKTFPTQSSWASPPSTLTTSLQGGSGFSHSSLGLGCCHLARSKGFKHLVGKRVIINISCELAEEMPV